MTYLYGVRFRAGDPELAASLREELFTSHIFSAADRNRTGPDTAVPTTWALRLLRAACTVVEHCTVRPLRKRSLRECLVRIRHEHEVTDRLGLSPVNTLLDLLVLAHAGMEPAELNVSINAFDYWRHQDREDGVRYVGARSQSWDTAFAVQSLTCVPQPSAAAKHALAKAGEFLVRAQVLKEIPNPSLSARSPVAGGWCFSEGAHRWPVSDCTAEAVEALLELHSSGGGAALKSSARFLLTRQNSDGGFGTYEARRGPNWLEYLNPAEMFTDCMTETSYVECTGSVALALARLRQYTDPVLSQRCTASLDGARDFLLRMQDKDGSWPAWWGVHRIYGTFFAVRGLVAAGLSATHPALLSARRWLTRVQHLDGSWSELPASNPHGPYRPGPAGTPVSTAWALLTLADLDAVETPAAHAGVAWLCASQRPDGSWPTQPPVGVFFGTALLDYRLYAAYFPVWALGRHLRTAPKTPSGA